MKKLIVLLCLLIALGLFGVCAIGAAVSEGKDQVTLTPRHLYGDPAAAQGATVSMLVHLDEHLLWNITHPIGGETQADYSLSLREMDFDRNASYLAVQLYGDFEYGLNTRTPVDELVGIELAYRELFDRTEPGTKGTAEVRLQDYYTYYPIRIDLSIFCLVGKSNRSCLNGNSALTLQIHIIKKLLFHITGFNSSCLFKNSVSQG